MQIRRSLLGTAALLAALAAPAAAQQTTETMAQRVAAYRPVRLTTDLSKLTSNERRMIPLLIAAAREMDQIFWMQAYGSRDSLMARIQDPAARRFAEINYGPWDRLRGDEPFVAGVGAKPQGARFYPADATRAELEQAFAAGGARADSLKDLYTLVQRRNGRLVAVPYHVAYAPQMRRAAALLRQAAALAPQASLRRYLTLRADALVTGRYQPSDLAWLDMKDNTIEVVIGPIETYEDALFGYKAGAEAYVLVKDQEWSRRLARYAALLPELQRGLPVDEALKREMPGTNSDLNAYDAVYYAGDANAGAKTIAINLPNDEQVQLQKGTRRLQLKNAMRAKFDAIMVPLSRLLIAPEQAGNVTFDAFFENTMFHEVAHGLGIKNTVNGRGTVREALKEQAGGLEEQKADVLGLYMVTQLARRGEMSGAPILNNYVTFLAGIFRSVRFGATSAHGRANMATFHFLRERGGFTRQPDGTYRVDLPKMQAAMDALSGEILRMQGNGDPAAVKAFMDRYGVVDPQLRADLDRAAAAGIPVDVVFEQGTQVLGL